MNRFVRFIAVLGGLLFSSLAPAWAQAPRPWVLALFPPSPAASDGAQVPAHLPLLLQAQAIEYLVATGRYSDLHVKQLQRMLDHEGRAGVVPSDPAQRWQLAGRLGADRALFAQLARSEGGFQLQLQAASLDKSQPRWAPPKTAQLPELLTEAVARGGRQLAEAVAALDGIALPAGVVGGLGSTRSPTALAAYGRCYAGLIKQSFRVDSPVLLSAAELQALEQQCREAMTQDPSWKSAQAAHLFVRALRASIDREKGASDIADLTRSLVTWEHDEGYQPFYFLAAYWLATCFISAERGAEVLRAALDHYPHSLMFHSALSRHLTWGDAPEKAVAAWRAYLALNPNSAYVRGGLSRALALSGQKAEALAEAEQAFARDPKDKEARIVLASRQIDLGAYDQAIALLAPLAESATSSADVAAVPLGELWLRLGYAYFKRQPPDLDRAERAFHKAVAAASQPGDWKVRAMAHADLAELYGRRGDHARADDERRLASGTTGASLYVRRRLEGESLQAIAAARGSQAQVPAPPAPALPARTPQPGRSGEPRVRVELNLRPLLCSGTELCSGKAPRLPANEAATVGTNRVEIGGLHSPMGSHNF